MATGERRGIHLARAAREIVGHVEDYKGGKPEAENGGGEHQVAAQIRRIENQQHRVGLADEGPADVVLETPQEIAGGGHPSFILPRTGGAE